MNQSNPDLSLLARRYEVHHKTEGNSPATVRFYNELLKRFLKWLDSKDLPPTLETIDEDLVRLYILDLQDRPGIKGPKMSTHTVANQVAGLKTFFGWLREATPRDTSWKNPAPEEGPAPHRDPDPGGDRENLSANEAGDNRRCPRHGPGLSAVGRGTEGVGRGRSKRRRRAPGFPLREGDG